MKRMKTQLENAQTYEVYCWKCQKKIHFFSDMEYSKMDNTSSTEKYFVDCPKCGSLLLTREVLRDGEINDFRVSFA